MQSYSYRLLTAQDLQAINELFLASFGYNANERLFEWKYFSNPSGNALVAGAFIEGKLVGSGAMIPEKLLVENSETTVYKCTDLMTHPKHQQRGISKKVNELLLSEVNNTDAPFCYTLCSKISTRSFIRNNWTFLAEVVYYFKPRVYLQISNLFRQNLSSSVSVQRISDKMKPEFVGSSDDNKIRLIQDSDYLLWRVSHPNFEYYVIYHYDNKRSVNGYLIYSISKGKVLNVLDIRTAKDAAIKKKLLLAAEQITLSQNLKGVMVFTVKNTELYRFIRQRGYLSNPFKRGPLQSILDFNIYNRNPAIATNDLLQWEVSGLWYDDI